MRFACYGTAREQDTDDECEEYQESLRTFAGAQVMGSLEAGKSEIKNMVETVMKFILMMMKAQKLKMVCRC